MKINKMFLILVFSLFSVTTVYANHLGLFFQTPTSNFWGDQSDGVLNTTGNVTYTSISDGDMIVKQYKSLTINAGHTVTVSSRNRGLLIYVDGDATINGTLTMSSKGAYVNPDSYSVPANGFSFIRKASDGATTAASSDITGAGAAAVAAEQKQRGVSYHGKIINIAKWGGSGGANGSFCPNNGPAGGTVTNGSGGGGAGSNAAEACSWGHGGYGNQGTIFSGGSGGAGRSADRGGGNATAYGGPGGDGSISAHPSNQCGGGAGNPGGAGGPSSTAGQSGTGGLLIIFVKGKLTIGSTGVISSNGTYGGNGCVTTRSYDRGSGGGGSGGGNVVVVYGTELANSGTVQASGGAGGTGCPGGFYNAYTYGGYGGAGSVQTIKVDR